MVYNIRLAIGLVVAGLILLSASVAWPRLIKDDHIWSEGQAHEHSQAASSLHHMTHAAAEAQLQKINEAEKARWDAELKAAQDRYETSRSEFNRTKWVRSTATAVMRWSGTVFLLLGVVRYFALQNE